MLVGVWQGVTGAVSAASSTRTLTRACWLWQPRLTACSRFVGRPQTEREAAAAALRGRGRRGRHAEPRTAQRTSLTRPQQKEKEKLQGQHMRAHAQDTRRVQTHSPRINAPPRAL